MPISQDEFNADRRGADLAIRWYLRDRANRAYTALEIAAELHDLGMTYTLKETLAGLGTLVLQGRVEMKTFDEETYYSYLSVLGFRPPG